MADVSSGGGGLGTTYSCVAIWRRDRSEVIANDQGNRLTPSCIAFTDDEMFAGEAVVNLAALNPTNTVFGEHYCTQHRLFHHSHMYIPCQLLCSSVESNTDQLFLAEGVND